MAATHNRRQISPGVHKNLPEKSQSSTMWHNAAKITVPFSLACTLYNTVIHTKESEDSFCDRFEESDWKEVEFERTSTPDTCKRISLHHTASAAFRTDVSKRDVALIASAVLQDAGHVTEDKNLVVDKNKIRRENKKLGEKIQDEENIDGLKIKSVFFDGKRDKTLFIGKKGQATSSTERRRTCHSVV
ncbi:hypothetical protein AVEN_268548-1 [Araneus ventricosus]|uniref:Uncharacterized protein n=1 Tax=Araneus ventricosus TaxID=182803 RepID=A0A4Y2MS82_ARAVE|nr:hypothetical protein AVEN_268548-1 [Araneus ventricosus]